MTQLLFKNIILLYMNISLINLAWGIGLIAKCLVIILNIEIIVTDN